MRGKIGRMPDNCNCNNLLSDSGIDSGKLCALPFPAVSGKIAAVLPRNWLLAQLEQSGLGSHGLSTRAPTDDACGLLETIFRQFFDQKQPKMCWLER